MTLIRGKCTQLEAVRWLISDGEWWGLERLTKACRDFVGCTETAISARIRELRNDYGLNIESSPLRHKSRQLKYRLVLGGEQHESQPTKETRGLEDSSPDFSLGSPPHQKGLFDSGGGGFAGNPQESAPAFSEYPD